MTNEVKTKGRKKKEEQWEIKRKEKHVLEGGGRSEKVISWMEPQANQKRTGAS